MTESEAATGKSFAPHEESKFKRGFDALFPAHCTLVITTDAKGRFVERQADWEAYTGQTWEQYCASSAIEKIHPEDREAVLNTWKRAVELRQPYNLEMRIWHHASQTWRWCSSRGVPVRDSNGNVLEFTGSIVDIDSRWRTEQSLQESERRFRSLLERVQAVGLMLDAQGRIIFANDFLLQSTGWTREEVLGRDYFDIFIQGTSDIRERFYDALAKGDIFPHAENEIVTRNGERRLISWDNTILRNTDGAVTGTATIGRDITESRASIRTLQSSEQKFRTLVEAMPQLVWATRPDGNCDYLSQRWREYTGQHGETGFGLGWLEAIHPEDHQRIEQQWIQFIRGEGAYDVEYRLRRHDGVYRWFKARAAALRSESGQIVSIYGTSTDIHEQKVAEEALRKSEENLRVALAASATGTFRWDPRTFEFIEFGETLRPLFGFKSEESVTSAADVLARVHPSDLPHVVQKMEECRVGTNIDMEFRVVHPNGDVRWVYDRGRPVQDAQGNLLYFVGACTDITLRKRAEEVMLRSEKLAAAGSVAATLAHEINNPLEGLLNLIYLARQPHWTAKEREEMLAAAELEITRASEMAKRSLRFYRGEKQGGRTESLQKVMDSVVYVYGPRLHQHGVSLDKKYLADGIVAAPESDLRQVFYNLVSNAVDAMPSGGRLVVKLSSCRDADGRSRVRVSVADTGRGIAPAIREKLFKPFFTTKGDRGTGLGLWVTREITEKHGGHIQVRSRSAAEHHGTVFSVLLPATITKSATATEAMIA